jgi:hypothetical protein
VRDNGDTRTYGMTIAEVLEKERVAVKVRDLGPREGWEEGSALYRLYPDYSLTNSYGRYVAADYVIVAVTDHALDYGDEDEGGEFYEEVSVLYGQEDGGIYEWEKSMDYWPMGARDRPENPTWDEELFVASCEVQLPGTMDHQEALSRFQGGYRIVEEEPEWARGVNPMAKAKEAV